jgi:hypothetical protein
VLEEPLLPLDPLADPLPLLVPLPDPLVDPLPDPLALVPLPEPLAMPLLLAPMPLLVPLDWPELDPPLPEPPPSSDPLWSPPEDPHRVTTKTRATRVDTRSIEFRFMRVRLSERVALGAETRVAATMPLRWRVLRTPSHPRMRDVEDSAGDRARAPG